MIGFARSAVRPSKISKKKNRGWNPHIRVKNPIDVTPAKLVREVLNPGAGVQCLWL